MRSFIAQVGAVIALTISCTASIAETEIGGALIFEPTEEKTVDLGGRDSKTQNLEMTDAKIKGDVIFRPKRSTSVALAGRDIKKQNLTVR